MKESILREKAEAFATRIIKMNQYLVKEKREFSMSGQVLRSGTSISANLAEAQFGQSKSDFISKLSIAQKEANETYLWLRNLFRGGYLTEVEFKSMESDVLSILKMISASILTARKNECAHSSTNN